MSGESLGRFARKLLQKALEKDGGSDGAIPPPPPTGGTGSVPPPPTRHMDDGEAFTRAVLPGLAAAADRAQADGEARVARHAAEGRARIDALPKAGIGLSISGAVSGTWAGQLPADVTLRDATDDHGQPTGRSDLNVDLVVNEDEAPTVAGQRLLGWTFSVPDWHRGDVYDLNAIMAARGMADGDYGDTLALGSFEEAWTWVGSMGKATIDVADDCRSLTVRMHLAGAGGEIDVAAQVNLPTHPGI